MAKVQQELSWVNVNASELSGPSLKAWNTMKAANEAFKDTMVVEARKAKVLGDDETLAINIKGWGFGMAKKAGKVAKVAGKAGNGLFSGL